MENVNSRGYSPTIFLLSVITSIIVLNFSNLSLEFLYLLIIFFVGALSDLKKFNSPKFRLFVQSIIILLFVYQFQIQLLSTRLEFLDYLLSNIYFNIIFVSNPNHSKAINPVKRRYRIRILKYTSLMYLF